MSKLTYKKRKRRSFELMDWILLILLTGGFLVIIIPFFNVIAVSFSSYREYLESTWMIWPKEPTLDSYQQIFKTNQIFIGYKTTIFYLLIGVPLNLFLCVTMAYAFCRKGWPGRKAVLMMVLITMIFHGGIVPLFLVMRTYHLIDTIWSVVLGHGMNVFNMILIYNYFCSLPESLIESANLDGASEWTILFRIVLPLSKPILATVVLFCSVSFWNEYFQSMIFLRSNSWQSLQQVLRAIVVNTQMDNPQVSVAEGQEVHFTNGVKMAAVVVTMLPVMFVYPFLQKHFTKGILMGAIKA